MDERKEWVRVSHAAGKTNVTVTISEGNLTARWSVKTFAGAIKVGVLEARAGAEKAITDLREALSDLEAAA